MPTGTYQVTVVFTETEPGAATAIVLLPILLLPFIGPKDAAIERSTPKAEHA
jgi:hypothetical protein